MCTSVLAHYNPTLVDGLRQRLYVYVQMPHGGRLDSVRHVGDLGNIIADKYGVSRFSMVDSHVILIGVCARVYRRSPARAQVDIR